MKIMHYSVLIPIDKINRNTVHVFHMWNQCGHFFIFPSLLT